MSNWYKKEKKFGLLVFFEALYINIITYIIIIDFLPMGYRWVSFICLWDTDGVLISIYVVQTSTLYTSEVQMSIYMV